MVYEGISCRMSISSRLCWHLSRLISSSRQPRVFRRLLHAHRSPISSKPGCSDRFPSRLHTFPLRSRLSSLHCPAQKAPGGDKHLTREKPHASRNSHNIRLGKPLLATPPLTIKFAIPTPRSWSAARPCQLYYPGVRKELA